MPKMRLDKLLSHLNCGSRKEVQSFIRAGRVAVNGTAERDGTVCRPALLELLPDGRVRVTLHEGKYHQVKRMIAACGATVTFLKRVQLGGVRLDESLAPGEFRELTEEELGALRPPDGL